MHVLSIAGNSGSGKTTLVEQVAQRLSEDGTVGTVKHIDCAPELDTSGKDTERHRAAGAIQTYGIGDEGWFATGEDVDLETALSRLAERCEYVLVEGYSDFGLPTVVLGDRTVERGEVLEKYETAEAADVAEIVAALNETEPYETLGSLVAKVKRSPDGNRAGAIATFTGRVRAKEGPEDEPTEHLEFEKYEGVAEEKMATIREEIESREGVHEVLLHHKTGLVSAGEDIVFVVVLAGHRTEAFRAVEDGINRLKEEVPLFKKEVTVGEEFWAHER